MGDGEGSRWLRHGCFGCLAFCGALLLIVAALVGVAALKARSEQVVDRDLTPPLPAPATAVETGAPVLPDPARPGRVVLDLNQAEFRIDAAGPGQPLRVEASYDESSYELVESYEPGDGEAGWVYRVVFRRSGGWLMTSLKQALGGTAPSIRILLPPDVPIALELAVRQGAVQGNLGGLWLTTAELDLDQAGFELGFERPLRAPLDRLAVDMSMAGGVLASLGHASPARLELDVSMGGVEIDLRGQWVQDATIALDSRMAGTVVRLPREVRIVGLDRKRPLLDEPAEVEPPTLTFEITADDRGKIEFLE